MKKILIVLPDFQVIGAQRVAIDFGAKLSEIGYKVNWAAGINDSKTNEVNDRDVNYYGAVLFKNVRVLRIFEALFRLFILVKGFKGGSIISVTPLLNRFLCFCKLLGVISGELIIEEHAYPPRSYFDEFPSRLVRYFYKNTEWLYAKADKIRVLTTDTHKYYYEEVGLNNLVVFPNLMNFNRVSELAKKYESVETFDFVYIGRFETQKNIIFLIRTMSIYLKQKKLKLLIIGYGSLDSAIRSFISEMSLGENVKIKSSSEENYAYLSKAKVFPFTSQWEGYGLVLLEAMHLGVAVVSVDCKTGPRDIIGNNDERGWIVPENNSEKFINAVDQAINNKIMRADKILNAKKYVDDNLDIDKNFNKYVELFIK
jgi:glycosyltransferase involved in cell wall biosynthesis